MNKPNDSKSICDFCKEVISQLKKAINLPKKETDFNESEPSDEKYSILKNYTPAKTERIPEQFDSEFDISRKSIKPVDFNPMDPKYNINPPKDKK